jgi:Peptidase family M23
MLTRVLLLTLTVALVLPAVVPPARARGKRPRVIPFEKPRPPWPRRYRHGVKAMPWGLGLANPGLWPTEPPAPRRVRQRRFARALGQLCRKRIAPWKLRALARWILSAARKFSVDPFLLGGLIYRQSRCDSTKSTPYGVGLAAINAPMHARSMRRRGYTYWVLQRGAWVERRLPLPRFAFTRSALLQPRANIYFAAAHLRIYSQQCPAIDSRFGSVPHRHPVSHFIWGDQVKDAGLEDRVLTARRRLLQYYTRVQSPTRGAFKSVALRCPLDGAPRKIATFWGEPRSGGRRRHLGVDFASTRGEPVRAVASGTVLKASTDLPGRGSISGARRNWKMGPGGLFVMIQHSDDLISAYMHLSRFIVRPNQRVRAGQLIGYVGRTGMKRDLAHLHFELRHHKKHIDPLQHIAPFVLVP